VHRCVDGKRITDGFNAGKYFYFEERRFENLAGLFEILTWAAAEPRRLVIRGVLTNDAPSNSSGQVRRTKNKQADGELPYFEEVARAWVLLDFDGVECPEGIDPISPEAMDYLRNLLPLEFQNVKCIWALSSSAGLTGSNTIRGHLWFVFDRPVTNEELKAWLSG
tara:strand:+ start:269 stop:763 length:495 start_codon:yes stop_codon:yes gene_type:complete